MRPPAAPAGLGAGGPCLGQLTAASLLVCLAFHSQAPAGEGKKEVRPEDAVRARLSVLAKGLVSQRLVAAKAADDDIHLIVNLVTKPGPEFRDTVNRLVSREDAVEELVELASALLLEPRTGEVKGLTPADPVTAKILFDIGTNLGRVKFKSDPPGALVELQKQVRGKTPRVLILNKTREYELKMSLKDYKDHEVKSFKYPLTEEYEAKLEKLPK